MQRSKHDSLPVIASDPGTHPGVEDLARCVDDLRAGEPRLPPALAAHVESCPHCQGQILDVLFFLRDPLASSGQDAARKRPLWLQSGARAAAAACLFILLLAAYFIQARRPTLMPPPTSEAGEASHSRSPLVHDSGQASAPAASRRTVRKADLAKAAAGEGNGDTFALNPNLESMVGSRSRGLAIEVHSPANHSSQEGIIVFSWKDFTSEPLSLSIVNNRNDAVFHAPVAGSSLQFSGALRPGCYYWKLESAADLYFVGKFLVPAAATPPGE